ncbi:hypothetical protein BBOV_III005635 [Babesia bovis T2Bo]|uniref:hypothetical protein n=1 Tax=Babesia bovis T2Bo TaxID=484906 RepID=UPI001C35D3DF|nr:hypothetical protein BBOV_III005635 [Babesia bovis T2Bo]KAG6439993.1 hypothetical protein BBOV_III005635 [Babesia bovis T2Bo]
MLTNQKDIVLGLDVPYHGSGNQWVYRNRKILQIAVYSLSTSVKSGRSHITSHTKNAK